jgi:hypothetical protein
MDPKFLQFGLRGRFACVGIRAWTKHTGGTPQNSATTFLFAEPIAPYLSGY